MKKDKAEFVFEMFKIHADQRLRLVQYFCALYAGIFAAASFLSGVNLYAGAMIFVVLFGISAVFWALEIRTKELVKISESQMKFWHSYKGLLDDFDQPEGFRVTYGNSLKIFYILMAVFALFGASVVLFAS
ncbi:hypothetical protein DYI37_13890 [Fulvimarina endophytica]|uniref:Uncharacterized protein n=1 Tax=Fulvimarina endophytica TaxID=2293836 RepID=A0A371X1B9_9HYPH|nr:hypothetical protein [Fulvimarina endophytica]RFC63032.1 hypothetical protein DYI37_13890 [Fulvimarina endophytica]